MQRLYNAATSLQCLNSNGFNELHQKNEWDESLGAIADLRFN